MTAVVHELAGGCRMRELAVGPQREFVAFDGREPGGLPPAPGAVLRLGEGASVLHYAPRRWLLAGACDVLRGSLAAAHADGALFDVDGKWRLLELAGSGAARILASGIEMQALLAGRDCAATTYMDCPLLVSRADGALLLWTGASYLDELAARLTEVRI